MIGCHLVVIHEECLCSLHLDDKHTHTHFGQAAKTNTWEMTSTDCTYYTQSGCMSNGAWGVPIPKIKKATWMHEYTFEFMSRLAVVDTVGVLRIWLGVFLFCQILPAIRSRTFVPPPSAQGELPDSVICTLTFIGSNWFFTMILKSISQSYQRRTSAVTPLWIQLWGFFDLTIFLFVFCPKSLQQLTRSPFLHLLIFSPRLQKVSKKSSHHVIATTWSKTLRN